MKYIKYETIKNPISPDKWLGKTIKKIIRVPFNWGDSLILVIFSDETIGYIRGSVYSSAQRKEWEQNYLWDKPILGKKEYPSEIEEMIKFLYEKRMFSPEEYDKFVAGRQEERKANDERMEKYHREEELKTLAELKAKYEKIH